MKRFITSILIACLLISITGCKFVSEKIQEPVTFYYKCADYLHNADNKIIAPEQRDGTDHIKDLEYLLRLYLMGPNDEELISPFPQGLQITDVRLGTDAVIVTLSSHLNDLTDVQRTIACTCLALTCMEISGMGSVTLMWENVVMTLDRASLTLYDSSVPTP